MPEKPGRNVTKNKNKKNTSDTSKLSLARCERKVTMCHDVKHVDS